MYKIILCMILLKVSLQTIQEDVQAAHEDYFIPFLSEILDECQTLVSDTLDLFESDSTDTYLPSDVSTLNYDQLKDIQDNVKTYIKQQASLLKTSAQQYFNDNYLSDYQAFLSNDLTVSDSLKIIEKQYKKTISLANDYNKNCLKAIETMGDAHVKILFATFKDCSKKGTCVA